MDPFDNDNTRGAPRWEGDYELWLEPLTRDWTHYAVCAQRFAGTIGIVLLRHPAGEPWHSECASLDRICATERAMYEAEEEWAEKQRAKTKGGTRA